MEEEEAFVNQPDKSAKNSCTPNNYRDQRQTKRPTSAEATFPGALAFIAAAR